MKKKGFTLVELLAVIVVLAIIAVIAIPTLINVIEKTKVNALKDSAYGVIEAGRLYVAQNQPDQDILFTITNNNITSEQTDKVLKYKGNIKNGIVIVSTSSKVAICIDNGKNYTVKLLDEEEVKTGTGTCESYEAANGEFIVNSPVAELRKEYERQLQEQKESYENRINNLENDLANSGAIYLGRFNSNQTIDVSSINLTENGIFLCVPINNGTIFNLYKTSNTGGWFNGTTSMSKQTTTLNGNTLSINVGSVSTSAAADVNTGSARGSTLLTVDVYYLPSYSNFTN